MAKNHHDHKHLHVGLVVLLAVVGIVGYRFVSYQNKINDFAVESHKSVMGYKTENSVEDAKMIAETIVSVPANYPVIDRPDELQKYIENISRQTGRDIVVVDLDQEVIADTIASNVGTIYTADEKDEVGLTIADAQVRAFVERSVSHPDGIERTVISFKDLRESVVGAIIISNSQIFK